MSAKLSHKYLVAKMDIKPISILVAKMGIKPISFLVANLVTELIAMLVAQCERTFDPNHTVK